MKRPAGLPICQGGPATCVSLTGAAEVWGVDSPGERDTSQISSSATSTAPNAHGQRARQRRRRNAWTCIGMDERFCSMAFSGARQIQGRARAGDRCRVPGRSSRPPEGGIQLADAVLLHELVALGLLFGFGLREREIQARRHGAEEHLHAFGEDDALGELARFPCVPKASAPSAPARVRGIVRSSTSSGGIDRQIHHSIMLSMGSAARQIVDVLRRQPEPGAQLAPHFVIFTTYGASSGFFVMMWPSSVTLMIGRPRYWSRSAMLFTVLMRLMYAIESCAL